MRDGYRAATPTVLARPWREVGTEVLLLSTIASLLTLLVVGAPHGFQTGGTVEVARVAGEEALAQVGWGFGVYIPTLLGFYAIVAGGQLIGGEAAAARVRRVLGFVAELMLAAIVPALLLIVLYVTVTPAKLGALLVVLPVTGVMIFLAVQLGGFLVPDADVWLDSLGETGKALRERLKGVRSRSRRPAFSVLLANVAAPTVVATLLVGPVVEQSPEQWFGAVVLFGGAALFFVVIGWACEFMSKRASDRVSRIAPWVALITLYVVLGAGIFFAARGAPWLVYLAWFLVLGGVLASTIGGGAGTPRWFLNWSIRGVAQRSAGRSAVKALRRTSAQARELRTQLAAPLRLTKGQRARAWLRRLSGGDGLS